ncbi:MAG: hypothetical protein CL489_10795 [Acidobacteria bacterium]|nr:hypothetical protein [Acidobacteriota bacterium]|tara:strand:- start:4429 stop:4731 length:303 start_codon:yes stop_codon:yes gene_type:complete
MTVDMNTGYLYEIVVGGVETFYLLSRDARSAVALLSSIEMVSEGDSLIIATLTYDKAAEINVYTEDDNEWTLDELANHYSNLVEVGQAKMPILLCSTVGY